MSAPPELLRAINTRQAKTEGQEIRFRCPAHDDHRPSARYNPEKETWFCDACETGGGWVDLCQRLDVSIPGSPSGQEVSYDYVDADGQLLFQVVRKPGKKFVQRRPNGQRGWIWKLGTVERVLYLLPDVLAAVEQGEAVYVVEGERDADNVAALGLAATTNSGGAGKWRKRYSESLKGAQVVIVPDHDPAGRDHAQAVARSLHGFVAEVRILNLPDLPKKGDVSDWIGVQSRAGKSSEEIRLELEGLAAGAPRWEPSAEGATTPEDTRPRTIPYVTTEQGLARIKATKDGEVLVPLTNFIARIVADISRDDGVETQRSLEIEVCHDGRRLRFDVPESRFPGMAWVIEHLGPTAVVYAGQGTKDHTRAAIQLLSDKPASRTVYTHLGWRTVDGQRCYLHAGGAIGAAGEVSGIEVAIPDELGLYTLPDPPEGEELAASIRASLDLVELLPYEVTMPVYCAVWRAAAGSCDFALHLAGRTGAGKSELAALAQQHYGAGLDARNLPGSWSSTANALEVLAFTAKDALLVVDDFAPEGTRFDVQRMHKDAARLLRAQGNRSGRQRLRPNASLRSTKWPRGLILSTGEDIPQAHSIRARTLLLEVPLEAMNWDLLTRCQKRAAEGGYAQAFAGYVRWLAQHHAELEERRAARITASKGQTAASGGGHRRTIMIEAELVFGLDLFLSFAVSAGAMTGDEADRWMETGIAALRVAASAQSEHLQAADPVRRFLELFQSALASGSAHLASAQGEEPEEPSSWGWRRKVIGAGANVREEWQALGSCVGWIDEDDIYLDPAAAYRAAEQMATGESLAISAKTLWKRLQERGVLASSELAHNTIRRQLQGRRRRVLHLKIGTLMPEESVQSVQSGREGGNSGSQGPISWTDSESGSHQSVRETGPQRPIKPGAGSQTGPIGPIGPIVETEDVGQSETDDSFLEF